MRLVLMAIIGLILVFEADLSGQSLPSSGIKRKWLDVQNCNIILDENTIIPNSIIILYQGDTITGYEVNNNIILFDTNTCAIISGDTLSVSYRSFDFNIEKAHFTLDSSLLAFKEKALITGYEYRPTDPKGGIIESAGLDYRGSFSRGLSVGNSQSLVLNSNFDMQLIGDLGNGLKVVAAISDENLPIQAQGNTQQLQEFDKVFIQVSKDRTSVTAGDYELRRPNSYFMNYFKKMQGITLASTISTSKNTEVFTKGSFAISRGKFARQTMVTREGNQGPYRLQGNNGERFIIVLAGTEKVFFNGILLTRGFDYDYVIDYNRAELTFSPTRVIARDSRVIVEFEYTDISYLRSLYATQTEYKGDKWSVNLNFYSEQDSKATTGDLQLDSTDIQILEESGDDLRKSVRNSLRTISDDEKKEATRILYAGTVDIFDPANIILRFTENLDSAQYTAVFTEVGAGNGDYAIDNTKNRNARVYKYVGKNMGSYLPVIQLIPPEQKQLITLNGRYTFNPYSEVFAEVGLSNLDKNRRSAVDNEDNTGISSHIAIKHSVTLDSASQWLLGGTIKHEYVNKNFNALNPFRAPEFVRDWNITQILDKGDENLFMGTLGISSKSGVGLEYGYNSFDRSGVYQGEKHAATVKYQGKRWKMRAFTNVLESRALTLDQQSSFIRPNITMQYGLDRENRWTIGAELDAESNKIRGIRIDTLSAASFSYQHLKWYLTSDFTKDFAIKLAFSTRDEQFALNNELRRASFGREVEVGGKWTAKVGSDLSWSLIGRDFEVIEQALLPNDKSKKTVLGRIDYILSAFNTGLRSTTSYNTNSGQEPKIEYVFQKVEVGQGDYFYIGESDNPNLTNILDFRYDPTNPLSRYIRLTLINNEFIRTNNIEINQNLAIDPSKFFKVKEGQNLSKMQLFISKFSTLSNIRVTKKKLDGADTPLISFLDFSLEDTSLVAFNKLNANTLFFNRGNVKYDLQAGNRNSQSRIIQVNGREDRGLDEIFLRTRWNLYNKADFFINLEKSVKSYKAEAFSDRNLDIAIFRFRPEVSLRPTTNTRVNFRYVYQDKKQRILTGDAAYLNEVATEFSLRKANQYSLDMSFSLVQIKFSGKPNSPIEYDMLEGLKNGTNYLWNMTYTKRMANNIDLTIHLEGRKTGVSPIVHVGRVQAKATF